MKDELDAMRSVRKVSKSYPKKMIMIFCIYFDICSIYCCL